MNGWLWRLALLLLAGVAGTLSARIAPARRPTTAQRSTPAEVQRTAPSEQEAGREARDGEGGGEQDGSEPGRTPAQWVGLGLSLSVVLALLGVTTALHLTGGDQAAAIAVTPRLDQVRQVGDLYYLPVEIVNRGDRTAQQVTVRLTLSRTQDRPETPELAVDYLPGGAEERLVAVFRQDPRQETVLVDSLGYLEP